MTPKHGFHDLVDNHIIPAVIKPLSQTIEN
jgi:hypothetical protein